jgi:hypothetical protein
MKWARGSCLPLVVQNLEMCLSICNLHSFNQALLGNRLRRYANEREVWWKAVEALKNMKIQLEGFFFSL